VSCGGCNCALVRAGPVLGTRIPGQAHAPWCGCGGGVVEILLEPVRVLARERYCIKKDAKRGKYRSRTGPRCCSNNCPAKGRTKDWLIRRRPQKRYEQVTVKRSVILKKKV
jgi:hypothetical protein